MRKTAFSGAPVIQGKGYVRSRQTVLSLIILCALMVIGAGIFLTQSHYNPALLQKNAFVSGPKEAPSGLAAGKFFKPLPQGIKPLTPAETFDRRNLSDKIDGKAELYLSAGFKGLVSQRFKDENRADLWVEAFVYDMGDNQNAFSVFSTQRRNDGTALDLAKDAYRTSNALFLIHGRYYLEIIASKASEDLPGPIKIMAETFISNTPSEAAASNESTLFPKEGQVDGSISLIAANAFGYEGFDKIYTAQYRFDGHTLMAYVSRRKTPEKAKEMAADYRTFLLAFGGKDIESQLPEKGARMIEILDTYEIVFSHGPYLAGVREAASADQAKTLAERLRRRLKE
ncbi:conserved hypothetical protein [delta proteobacterium NaphS2]|nr:conserved hypothetical protein [delta proteobacterium NaphS2]